MANKKMLIDTAHPEETRVAVMDGNQLEELDVESSARRQLKGNIYLAKVTRVEPSLQAAFVDYGGNRHGFLAFSEIHPDYYQIPVADREQLIAEDKEALAAEDADTDEDPVDDETDESAANSKAVETVGGDDIDEVEDHRRVKPVRRYKIQEVIKRRQILLVQVVKEERGNKGAALTTYLSLAGRYCVLMPNTGRGGGISRKIGSGADRKRLKSVVSDLVIPEGMAVIVRTAGADRGKVEIKRDFEYLIRLWTDIRNLTLESTAPAMIHEEANIIKRALRDIYSKDVSEILVEGEEGYRIAKDLMKVLVPSHAKKVQPYRDPTVPLFSRYRIESQLESMIGTEVQLKAGGYIVINATEALVAIDVNSGRATRGRNIEETALKTNLEAATEIARQLRLRDLAGLIVIDFIDMDYHRNQSSVERRMKESMRRDRARIQIGRISPFGLMEMSRQRLRPSITETTSDMCPHCGGTGIRRSTESTALHILRGIEEEGVRGRASEIDVAVPTNAALYILNNKRNALAEMEQKFELKIVISEDDTLVPPAYTIERVQMKSGAKDETENEESHARAREDGSDDEQPRRKRRRSSNRKRNDEANDGDGRDGRSDTATSAEASDNNSSDEAATGSTNTTDENSDEKPARRRRGRRGGRRRSRSAEGTSQETSDQTEGQSASETESKTDQPTASDGPQEAVTEESATAQSGNEDAAPEAKPKRRRVRKKKAVDASKSKSETKADEEKPAKIEADTPAAEDIPAPAPVVSEITSPLPDPASIEAPVAEAADQAQADENVTVVGSTSDSNSDSRRGWWQKLIE